MATIEAPVKPLLSVIVPALDAAAVLPATLAALEEGRAGGLLGEVIVVDGGSKDGTAALVEAAGAQLARAPRGRGAQLAAGGVAASGGWLLFLHADTQLVPGWAAAVAAFIAEPANQCRAAYMRFRLNDRSAA